MPGGAIDGGSPPQSKKFRRRSKSCPPRILGPKPARYFQTPFARKTLFDETDSYYDSDRDIAIGDFFATPPAKDSPAKPKAESPPSREYPSVFEPSSSGSEKYDVPPSAVQFLLDTASFRISELVRLGYLKEAKETEEETAQNVD